MNTILSILMLITFLLSNSNFTIYEDGSYINDNKTVSGCIGGLICDDTGYYDPQLQDEFNVWFHMEQNKRK